MAVLFKHASEPLPRPTKYVPTLPAQVENILAKALAKDPRARHQRMTEFFKDLESLSTVSLRKVSKTENSTSKVRKAEIFSKNLRLINATIKKKKNKSA